jgi:DNA-binding CsgD family transcriptional regulator|tara:strand:- start:1377 stop:1802 length:426 start_codon:yes stop_codon:yes gene_type:complete
MDKPWIDAAMHMREQGKKLQDIADVVGVAPSTVRNELRSHMGVSKYDEVKRYVVDFNKSERTKRIKESLRLNEKPAQIADREGVSRQYVYFLKWKINEEVIKAVDHLGDKDYIDDKVGILQTQEQRNETIREIEEMLGQKI